MDAGNTLAGARIVPVVVIEDAGQAVALAQTLCDAGLPAIEITLRTPAALKAIEAIASRVEQARVGAGSVRTAEQLDAVRNAGARFAVSPGHTDSLLDAADRQRMPLVPGAATASECMHLLERGYRLQKFFPAGIAGGVAALRALAGPLPDASFFPTGGITPALAPDYLALSNVMCIGGTWITPPALLQKFDWAAIGRIAKEAATLTG